MLRTFKEYASLGIDKHMIFLNSNKKQYLNDFSEEIRLFFPLENIVFGSETRLFGCNEDSVCIDLTYYFDQAQGGVFVTAVSGAYSHEEIGLIDSKNLIEIKRIEKRTGKIALFHLLQQMKPTDLPWGSLTGIRPTKLYRELQQKDMLQADTVFKDFYKVSQNKLDIVKKITEIQLPVINSLNDKSIDIYIHIPFCHSKCLYCSFPSRIIKTNEGEEINNYLDYLIKDIQYGAEIIQQGSYAIRAIYIGGGTPSVLSCNQFSRLLSVIKDCYFDSNIEYTIEAGRPDSIDMEKLQIMRDYGVNRVSINPQTMNDSTLQLIGRKHSIDMIYEAFNQARKVGIKYINMDLIAGLPGENAEFFGKSLEKVLAMEPDNVTIHTLAIKRSSRLHEFLNKYELPDEKEVIKMVDSGYEMSKKKGYFPYYLYRQKYMNGNLENIGYAKPDSFCIYNIDMMEDISNVLAHGANAMSKRVFRDMGRIERVPSPKDINTYYEKIDSLIESKHSLFIDIEKERTL